MILRMVSWNIRRSQQAWDLLSVDDGLDIALLQEAVEPSFGHPVDVICGSPDWKTPGGRKFTTAIARFSDRVTVEQIRTAPLSESVPGALGVSLPGTLCVANVKAAETQLTVASAYAAWNSSLVKRREIFADASAHRILSDLSPLLLDAPRRIVLVGDWNILFGYGEYDKERWRQRYQSFFDRVAGLGLVFAGPEKPNGVQAFPWPGELPIDSRNVPTFRRHRNRPETATRQLDFAFVSPDLQEATTVTALNKPDEWGPSDHCRIAIQIDLQKVGLGNPV